MEPQPLVSIVTVVYNAREALSRTIASVRAQKAHYARIEYIVVDGSSKDGTRDLIARNEDVVDRWISEPDKGIYDAMNKGLKMASGDFVWCLNAGYFIYSDKFLAEVFPTGRTQEETCAGCEGGWADVYYGQTQLVDAEWKPAGMRRLRAPRKLTPKSFRWGMLVCHQSILVRRRIAAEYDLRYRCSADYNWVLQALEAARGIVYTHRIMACYLKGGKSRQMLLLSWKERFRIMCIHFGVPSTLWFHALILLRAFWPAGRDYTA